MPKRILVVDDDSAISETVRDALVGRGYDVCIEPSPLMMLERLVSWDPHLVILDWRMPSEDGDAALVNLRDRGIQTPVLMMSAAADPVTTPKFTRMARLVGAQDFIAKPFDLDDLEARVMSLIGWPED